MLIFLGITLSTLLLLLYLWSRWHFSFWQRNRVNFVPCCPLLGNVRDLLLFRCNFGEQFQRLYDHRAANDQPFVGIHVLHNRALLLRHPELIKRVLVKDFRSFASRFESTDPVGDTMGSQNLFFTKYECWQETHKIFTPLFAHSNVRQMYPLLQQIGCKLEQHLAALPYDPLSASTIIEVKELCALFTTDLIASLAFGVQANSLQNPHAEFRQMCIEVNKVRPLRILHLFTMFFLPQLAPKLGTHLYSPAYESFMRDSINFVIAERERSGLQRHDLIDIFIRLKSAAELSTLSSVVNKPDFFVAQAAFFLLAGFDTSSSTITFALYELAKQPDIQRRLRSEIRDATLKTVTYERLTEMRYLGMVVSEVLRLYPPTTFLDRVCTTEAGYSLQPFGEFNVPQGMPIYISVLGLHRDEKLWPNPLKFDPQRFATEQKGSRGATSYLPFGSGPRGCIGLILALLQVKMGLIHILKNYRVDLCPRTLTEMKFDANAFVLAPEGGIFLQFIKDGSDEHID